MQRIITLLLPFPLTILIGFRIFRFGTTGPSEIDPYRLLGLIGAAAVVSILGWTFFRSRFSGGPQFWRMLAISILSVVGSLVVSAPLIWIIETCGSRLDFEHTPFWVLPVYGTLGLIPFLPMFFGLHIVTFALDIILVKRREKRQDTASAGNRFAKRHADFP